MAIWKSIKPVWKLKCLVYPFFPHYSLNINKILFLSLIIIKDGACVNLFSYLGQPYPSGCVYEGWGGEILTFTIYNV